MNKEKLIIREMKEGEEREIVKTGRRAFPAFEALFVESPRMTMAAVYEDKIIGGIIYKFISSGGKRIAYISEAFVDPIIMVQVWGQNYIRKPFVTYGIRAATG